MNTLQNKATLFANRASITIAMLSVIAGANSAALAGPPAPDSRSMRISIADLNLSTSEGRKSAFERLHQAARKLCSRVEDQNDLSRQKNFVACVDLAMANSLPMLQQLADRSEGAHLANTSQR